MIEYKRSKHGEHLMVSGELKETIADCMHLIQRVHSSILQQNSECAAMFQTGVKMLVNDADSPLWQPIKDPEGAAGISMVWPGEK